MVSGFKLQLFTSHLGTHFRPKYSIWFVPKAVVRNYVSDNEDKKRILSIH